VQGRMVGCLHSGEGNSTWSMTAGGRIHQHDCFDDIDLMSGIYRIIGVPKNYGLVVNLHESLSKLPDVSEIYVGSPVVCSRRGESAEDVLSCLSALDVQSCLSGRWFKLTNVDFNTYLLLSEKGRTGDLSSSVYCDHAVSGYAKFMLMDQKSAMDLISAVVDPRWFCSTSRPNRTSIVERYFGLTPLDYKKAWSKHAGHHLFHTGRKPSLGLPSVVVKRALLLTSIVYRLPKESFIWDELRESSANGLDLTDGDTIRRACKLTLNFIFRNWLQKKEGSNFEFDPDKFFKTKKWNQRYKLAFVEGENDA